MYLCMYVCMHAMKRNEIPYTLIYVVTEVQLNDLSYYAITFKHRQFLPLPHHPSPVFSYH